MDLGAPAVMSLTFMLFAFETHLDPLSAAIRGVEAELAEVEAEQDPLASHIFISRRHYRNANDTKGGKRCEINARLSFNAACERGFRGSLDEWQRLMGDNSAKTEVTFAQVPTEPPLK
jgi:hypothetical protein